MEKKNNNFKTEKIAVLGFGREGRSILKYLKNRTKAEIWILDKNKKLNIPSGIKSQLGKNYLSNFKKFNIVFRSPGIPYNLPQIQHAVKNGAKITSATKIFFNKAKGTIIGITGTKGKSTISSLLYKILRNCGNNVYLAGNIGKPAIEIIPKLKNDSKAILELSSFQLQDLKRSPHIAIVADIFPDHLDAHKNMREYLNAKANIARKQKKSDIIFYFKGNKYSKWIAQKSRGKKIAVNSKNFPFKNTDMAAAVARHLGCPEKIIIKTISGFRGLPHRLEFVRKIKFDHSRHSHYISFYNDSASTNPNTSAAAINSFNNPIILIAGGADKNLDYKPLAQAIKKSGNVKIIILFGENKSKIKNELRIMNKELGIETANGLKSAVNLAYQTAKKSIIHNSPFIILLSPGSASFDMFHDYADRGEKFKKIVKTLK